MSCAIRVLVLATYPELGASTRYRVLQYVPLLAEEGIRLDVKPFLSNQAFAGLYDKRHRVQSALGVLAGIGRRTLDVFGLGSYDLVFVQREAALVGPPVIEWLARRRLPWCSTSTMRRIWTGPATCTARWSTPSSGRGSPDA